MKSSIFSSIWPILIDISKRIMLAISICALLSPVALLQSTQAAFAVQAKPFTDWSFYMFRPDSNAAYNVGCNQGQFDANNGSINSEVILDFGGQVSGTDYNGIEAAAEQFAQGYRFCTGADTTSVLRLGIGTNNSADPNFITFNGGVTWAKTVNAVATWVNNNHYNTQIIVGGANDIEPSWSQASLVRNWAQGYASVAGVAGHGSWYLNFGSADGCPTNSTGNAGCNNGWKQDDVWYASWGASPAFPTPEIYFGSLAQQWAMISLYSAQAYGGHMIIQGPLDEHDEDTSTLDSGPAWNDLWTDLNNNSATAQNMSYSLQIHTINFG